MNEEDSAALYIEINKAYYNDEYSRVNIGGTIEIVKEAESFLDAATTMHTSWVGLYAGNLKGELKGKRVLELGCGDCLNVAVMSALGAEVYGNDIADICGNIIDKLNAGHAFEKPIKFIEGDFLKADFPDNFFDIVIGKAFVHHLTPEQEIQFTEKIARILTNDGMVRYFEPAVNSKFIDTIRWMIPMNDRPSILQKEKFSKWKALDPHPLRDNSSRHYRKIGKKYFQNAEVIPFGSIERFHRFLPKGKFNRKFRQFGFRLEKIIPLFITSPFARCQVITYRNPK
jgi:SAM-dependent methyltransferase